MAKKEPGKKAEKVRKEKIKVKRHMLLTKRLELYGLNCSWVIGSRFG